MPGSAPGPAGGDPSAGAITLSCAHLTKRFGSRVAVDDLSFEVRAGECYGLLGPNGAGKTTTISMVCGLLAADGGTVTVCGMAGGVDALDAKAQIGYVPQELAVYPDLSATENLTFFGRLYGLGGTALAGRVAAVLEVAGLADRSGERVARFSGGMKRRLNIAAGLLHKPRLLVLDEPTAGVDPQSRIAILDTVAALAANGTAVLYTTHYIEEAERLCQRIGIVDGGRLIAEGTRDLLLARSGTADVLRVEGSGDVVELAHRCAGLAGVHSSAVTPTGVELTVERGRNLVPEVVVLVQELGVELAGIESGAGNLEDVFLSLTGRGLRD